MVQLVTKYRIMDNLEFNVQTEHLFFIYSFVQPSLHLYISSVHDTCSLVVYCRRQEIYNSFKFGSIRFVTISSIQINDCISYIHILQQQLSYIIQSSADHFQQYILYKLGYHLPEILIQRTHTRSLVIMWLITSIQGTCF